MNTTASEMVDEIISATERCKRVIERVGRLPPSTNITDSCKRTLLKLANSELSFLSRSSSSLDSSPPPPLSVNIGHLEAVVHILEQPFVTGVSRVCKRVSLSPPGTRNGKENKSGTNSSCSSSTVVHVDIVCTLNKRPVWIIVSDRNPAYVYWHGYHKDKGLKLRIEQVIAAALSTKLMRPQSIVLFFPRGVGESVREKLQCELGACDFDFSEELDGGWIKVATRSYAEASLFEIKLDADTNPVLGSGCAVNAPIPDHLQAPVPELKLKPDDAFHSLLSGMKIWSPEIQPPCISDPGSFQSIDDLLNFSTTALIAIVSGISNGCAEKLLAAPECELRQQFKGNTEFVIGQVMSEIENPLLSKLAPVLSEKRGIVCHGVVSEFKELVSMFAGPNEKYRAHKLLESLLVVPDCPSERMASLPTTRKLDSKSKIVFGTGDTWRAPTLTANMGFVRAVSQTGMSLFTIGHRPRALIGD